MQRRYHRQQLWQQRPYAYDETTYADDATCGNASPYVHGIYDEKIVTCVQRILKALRAFRAARRARHFLRAFFDEREEHERRLPDDFLVGFVTSTGAVPPGSITRIGRHYCSRKR